MQRIYFAAMIFGPPAMLNSVSGKFHPFTPFLLRFTSVSRKLL